MEKDIVQEVNEIAEAYSFREIYCPNFGSQEKKAVLAMLERYIGRVVGVDFPQETKIVDFGCGTMLYADALINFFEKYGNKEREVTLIGIDDTELLARTIKRNLKRVYDEGNLRKSKIIYKNNVVHSDQDLDRLLDEENIQGEIDVVTLFAPGRTDDHTRRNLMQAIKLESEIRTRAYQGLQMRVPLENAFNKRLKKGGLIFVATENGGGLTSDEVRESLENSGCKVILKEENKFRPLLSYIQTYDDIVIGVKT